MLKIFVGQSLQEVEQHFNEWEASRETPIRIQVIQTHSIRHLFSVVVYYSEIDPMPDYEEEDDFQAQCERWEKLIREEAQSESVLHSPVVEESSRNEGSDHELKS